MSIHDWKIRRYRMLGNDDPELGVDYGIPEQVEPRRPAPPRPTPVAGVDDEHAPSETIQRWEREEQWWRE